MKLTGFGVIRNGKLALDNRRTWDRAVAQFGDGEEILLTIESANGGRSLEANALYWVGYIKPLVEYTGEEPLLVHQYLKKRFLPMQHLMLRDKDGTVFDELDLEPSTRKLSKSEFKDYLDHIQAFAAEHGVRVGSNREAA